ncbi:hypothetical protein [Bacillus solitudinis]|uniref:hypothetical protein n=1 Tax=Bacillus solitudinis TaxID=2014074 RepID=UPI000C23692A|nr:hypothetical protein [Bacillus solitudinis]
MNLFFSVIIYSLPMYLYVYLAVITIKNNPKSSKHLTSGLTYSLLSIWFLLSLLLALVPNQYAETIIVYWILPVILLITVLTFHLWPLHDGVYKRKFAWVFKLLLSLSVFLLVTFYVDGWMVREFIYTDSSFSMLPAKGFYVYWVILLTYLSITAFLIIRKLKTNPKLAKLWLFGLVLFVGWTTLMIIGWLANDGQFQIFTYLLPHGTIFWSLAIYTSMRKFNFLPSFEKRYKVLFNQAPLGILVLDEEAVVREASPLILRYIKPNGEINGRCIFDYSLPEGRIKYLEEYKEIFQMREKLKNFEYQFHSMHGSCADITDKFRIC